MSRVFLYICNDMATSVKKTKTVWFCSNCGNEYDKWMGRCPACGEWNTLV